MGACHQPTGCYSYASRQILPNPSTNRTGISGSQIPHHHPTHLPLHREKNQSAYFRVFSCPHRQVVYLPHSQPAVVYRGAAVSGGDDAPQSGCRRSGYSPVYPDGTHTRGTGDNEKTLVEDSRENHPRRKNQTKHHNTPSIRETEKRPQSSMADAASGGNNVTGQSASLYMVATKCHFSLEDC